MLTRFLPTQCSGRGLMSIAVMTCVWKHSRHRGGPLLLLLAIADYADDAGTAFPSVKSLMEKARLPERSVQDALRCLRNSGELLIDLQAGPHRCNLYRIVVNGADIAPREIRTPRTGVHEGADSSREGADQRTQRVRPAAPEPSIRTVNKNRQKTVSVRASARKNGHSTDPALIAAMEPRQ